MVCPVVEPVCKIPMTGAVEPVPVWFADVVMFLMVFPVIVSIPAVEVIPIRILLVLVADDGR